MQKNLKIGHKKINQQSSLYLIAEAGVNHENDLSKALEMVDEAARAGADAIKFQSYKAEKIASKFSPAYWDTKKEPTQSQYELFKKYDSLGVKDYKLIARRCQQKKIHFLTSCFDTDFVRDLAGVLPAYKIASADITNFELLSAIAKQGKPVLLSTGAATMAEIFEAVEFVKAQGSSEIALLHCVLNYPCSPENAKLEAITTLKRTFPDLIIGYSDHVPPEHGMMQLHAAWMLGARVIEKHFTLDKTLPGNDHYHAMDPQDIKQFLIQQKFLNKLMGGENIFSGRLEERRAVKYARRSLVAKKAMKKGQKITKGMIAVKRPGTGIETRFLDLLVGAKIKENIAADTILKWSMFLDL